MSVDASSLVAEGQNFLELSIADLVFVLQRVGHFQMSIYKHLVIILSYQSNILCKIRMEVHLHQEFHYLAVILLLLGIPVLLSLFPF